MTRIEVPAWARRPEVWLDGMRLSEYYAIQEHRDRMLDIVHREVEEYMNTPALYYEDSDWFPDRLKMTGEYYVADESYGTHVNPVRFQIGIMCHCLEKPWRSGQETFDYLGLEVELLCVPGEWSFSVDGTNSSVI